MRARHPHVTRAVEGAGVTLGYEVFVNGPVTALQLPTWAIRLLERAGHLALARDPVKENRALWTS